MMKNLTLCLLFVSAMAFGADEKAKPKSDRYENIELFNKVLNFVEKNYVEDVNNRDLIYNAIKGMLENLDPHSNFLSPETFKEMRADTSGKFGGVGIEVGMRDNVLTVVSPIEDTPAFKAGVKAGDKIIKINGETTKGMSLSEAVTKMRGKRGSEVSVVLWRKAFGKPKEFKMKREEIKIATVKSELLEPGYLYLRLTTFSETSGNDMKKVLDQHQGKIKGLVLDLRGNPGGLLEQAVDVTSLFVDEGVVVSTNGRAKENKEIKYAKKGMAQKDFQMAVLVNGSSASASEIVAGALQDHKRAVIMGQPTFGKGSVQTVVELGNGVGLKLTIARYYTPNGRSIQLKGIQPDVTLEDLDQKVLEAARKKSDGIREKDLKRAMVNDQKSDDSIPEEVLAEMESGEKKPEAKDDDLPKKYVAKEDYQVHEALNYIKSYQGFRAAELSVQPADKKVN